MIEAVRRAKAEHKPEPEVTRPRRRRQ
jgi:hypothetical protein